MSATVFFLEDNGAILSPLLGGRGTIRTTGVTNWDWKNVGDATTPYTSSPITAGNNSFKKFGFLMFSGNFFSVSGVTLVHTGQNFPTGLTGLTVSVKMGDSGFYEVPSTTAFGFAQDYTLSGSSGIVLLGGNGPEFSGKASNSLSNPAFSQYIGSQLNTHTTTSQLNTTPTFYWNFTWTEN